MPKQPSWIVVLSLAVAVPALNPAGCGSSTIPTAGDAAGTDVGGSGGRGASGCVVPAICCEVDGDCLATEECVNPTACTAGQTTAGMCKPKPAASGMCWRAADCSSGTCAGSQVCPCGAACLVADRIGTCAP